VSAFGSGVDQNQFFIDGMNVSAPTTASAAPAKHRLRSELQISRWACHRVRMSRAMVNIITGSAVTGFYGVYYAQPRTLPMMRRDATASTTRRRLRTRQVRTSRPPRRAGGRRRLWFFWLSAPARLRQSAGTNRPTPGRTSRTRYSRNSPGDWLGVATGAIHESSCSKSTSQATRRDAVRPRIGAGNDRRLTHAPQAARCGACGSVAIRRRRDVPPSAIGRSSRVDQPGNVWSQRRRPSAGEAQSRCQVCRHYGPRPGCRSRWKLGAQLDRGGTAGMVIPGGERRVPQPGLLNSALRPPTGSGFVTAAFVFDRPVGSRVTINAGFRSDHPRHQSDMRRLVPAGDTMR
jgi:hypothetical protein